MDEFDFIMVINDERDWCFYHIMKCGGTSIRSLLNDVSGSVDSRHMRIYKHIEVRYWPKPITQKRVFTVVRNPWERFHSLYWDIKSRFRKMHKTENKNPQLKAWYLETAEYTEKFSFPDWILHGKYIHPAEYKYTDNPLNTLEKSMSYCIDGHDMDVIRLEDGQLLDEYLSDLLGYKVERDTLNKSKRPNDYHKEYNRSARDRVAEVCDEDIRRWGYDF